MVGSRWMAAGALVCAALACADPAVLLAPDVRGFTVDTPGHHAVGSGHVLSPAGLREFTFHALARPQSGVAGSYKVVLASGLFFEADVTCLSVSGNTAWVGGRIRATNAAAVVVGSSSMFYAVDRGEGDGADDQVSVAVFNAAAGTELAFCESQPLELAVMAVTDGNVQVR